MTNAQRTREPSTFVGRGGHCRKVCDLKVIIVGAGIGGCATALALRRAGCRVEVYEQAPEKTEVGAGTQISPNASRLLQRYGLGSALETVAVRPVAVEARRWQDGKILPRRSR